MTDLDPDEIETVADLPADQTVYHAGRPTGARTRVHTDSQCRHYQRADRSLENKACEVLQRRPVCQICLGFDDFAQEPGTDVNATRKKLLAMDPDDVESGGEAHAE